MEPTSLFHCIEIASRSSKEKLITKIEMIIEQEQKSLIGIFANSTEKITLRSGVMIVYLSFQNVSIYNANVDNETQQIMSLR